MRVSSSHYCNLHSYSEIYSVASRGRMHITEPRKFLVSYFLLSLLYPCVNRLFHPIYTTVCLCFCKMKRKWNKLKKMERWPCQEGGRYCENEWWEISGVGGACLDLKKFDIFFFFSFFLFRT